MFTYSKIHDWQEEASVKQILVFPSQLLKDKFSEEYALRVEKDGVEKASDSNAGAVYKIRAVKNGNDMWDGVIRCGISDRLLFEQCDLGASWEVAMANITNQFTGIISESCKQLFSFVSNKTNQ